MEHGEIGQETVGDDIPHYQKLFCEIAKLQRLVKRKVSEWHDEILHMKKPVFHVLSSPSLA